MNPHPVLRRRLVLGTALGLAAASAGAQVSTPARRYALMSLVGDKLTAVERGEQTGSRLDKNLVTDIPVRGDVLDRAALGVINQLIVQADPAAKPLALLTDEPVLYEQQARLFDGKFVRLPSSLVKAAKDGGASHVFLVSKQRSTLNFRFLDGRQGQGAASGLGYYLEPNLVIDDIDASKRTQGFLGLFVHIRLTVVNLASEAIVGDRDVAFTDLYLSTGARARGALPWDALSPTDKIKTISEMLMQALRDNAPALLKPA
jgi:hypothetical protein